MNTKNKKIVAEAVAWIITRTNFKGEVIDEFHISKHDGWKVIVIMTEETQK